MIDHHHDHHLRIMIERLQRQGASEREIEEAVLEAAPEPRHVRPPERGLTRWTLRLIRS